MTAPSCSATVPLEGEPADCDRRQPCGESASRLLIWSDGDERLYCGIHAGALIESSSVRQTFPAVAASAPIDEPMALEIHRPDLWQHVLQRELPPDP
jgi:hypothetical protein